MANISHRFENKKDSNNILNMNSADADGVLSLSLYFVNFIYKNVQPRNPDSH